MNISVRHRDDIAIFDVSGDIIGDARIELNNRIQEEIDNGFKKLIVNLEDVPMMDSVGLGMLVAIHTSLGRKGSKIVLLNPGRSINYLLTVTKLNNVIAKYDGEDQAIASFEK